jgi:hypothetical protein
VTDIAALHTTASMLYRVRKQLLEEGFEAVLAPVCQWRAKSPHLWQSKIPQVADQAVG